MSVSVTKVGPYFNSGEIKFSELRNRFKETSSGSVRARELLRNADTGEANPVVPDSTENEQISTGSNWKLSQFRNSVKRYFATQTGDDTNSSYDEPGFRMGRLDSNGRGIDWSGGGYFGRDGQGGGTTGNLLKNIQKFISITGTCGSVRPGQPGAQLSPALQVNNVRMTVSGTIMGYGGRGGGRGGPDPSGESGTTGLNLGNVGSNNSVTVSSGGKIYGGGGGGERGRTGANGRSGECLFTSRTQGCGTSPSCPSGYSAVSSWSGTCCSYKETCTGSRNKRTCSTSCVKSNQGFNCERRTYPAGGIGGVGGAGGNGRGFNNRSGDTNGEAGKDGTQPPGATSSSTSSFNASLSLIDSNNGVLNVSGGGGQGYCYVTLSLYTNDNASTNGTSYSSIKLRDGLGGSSILKEWDFPGGDPPQGTRSFRFKATAKQYRIQVDGNVQSLQIESGYIKLRDNDGSDVNARVFIDDIDQTTSSSGFCAGGTTVRNPTAGENGENGGSGGDWGTPGTGTSNSGEGGSAGKAISSENSNRYNVDNRGDIKGGIY
jgi:hypothetical protein